jgi:hypothetical protein
MIIQAKDIDLISLLTYDVRNGHSLYCSSTNFAQFSILDSILKSFKKFEVSNIVLIDPRSISHNPWKKYIKDIPIEMVLNDFVVISKYTQTFVDPSINVITNSLKEEFGESYATSLTKIVEPAITRYELRHNELKLTLYLINYDVAATLLLLQQMNKQEQYSSSCSTGLVLNSIVGDWGVIAHNAIKSFLIKINFKPHYVISNNFTVWENYTSPSPLTGDLTISFESPFLAEYFEMLRSS